MRPRERFSGAKAQPLYCGLYGTTEVVPLHTSTSGPIFSATVPIHTSTFSSVEARG
jgi:hypothetical protein